MMPKVKRKEILKIGVKIGEIENIKTIFKLIYLKAFFFPRREVNKRERNKNY